MHDELDRKSPTRNTPDRYQDVIIGSFWLDQFGSIIYANPAFLQMLGRSAGDINGLNIDVFLNTRKDAESILLSLRSNEVTGSLITGLKKLDGASIPVHLSWSVQPNTGSFHPARFIVAPFQAVDSPGSPAFEVNEEPRRHPFTASYETPPESDRNSIIDSERRYRMLLELLERKVKEKTIDLQEKNEELRKSEERYHRMVEEVEDYAIILLDRKGTILNWNRGAEKIKGYKDEEIIGQNFEVFYPEEDRRNGLPKKLIQQAAKTGKSMVEAWRLRKDGTRFWGSIVMTALHNSDDEVIGFTKVTRDLTERKIAEDRLQEYSRELEFRNKELEQFAFAASHDMKEPLRKIHLYCNYIREHGSDKLDERSVNFLDRAVKAADRMNRLIEDLLAYSRTTSGEAGFEQIDLNVLLKDIADDYKEELEQKNIRLEIDELPQIRGILFQIKQLMFNLIDNSIKYAHPDRPGLVRIFYTMASMREIRDLHLNTDVSYLKITIQDNGLGFQQEYADKIFEVFQRLGNKQEASGSGIGLAICKKIALNHKGSITATGVLNEGARFDLFLPAL